MQWSTDNFYARVSELHAAFQKILARHGTTEDHKILAELDLKKSDQLYRLAWYEVAHCEVKRFEAYELEHNQQIGQLKYEYNSKIKKLEKENRDMAKQCVQAMEELMQGVMNEKTFWTAIEDARVKISAMQWAIE